MASEISLKYLHPSVTTYITTENYSYDTSVNNEVLFVADVFEKGKDNEIQKVSTVDEFIFKYGTPNFAKFGQAGYNTERWLTSGGSAYVMRLLPENASYAHAIFNVQVKNETNGKTVLDNEDKETKIDDVYLRPVITYIGVNNTSEALLESELSEDRSKYKTTDGYQDMFIFAVYPEGRGEYYNDLGFRIRLNNSYDTALTSRVYTFEVIKYSSDTSYDIVDGPYYVSFDPNALDPNSQKSMFIENVVNSYSEYVRVSFNTENYRKLAAIINPSVDPYKIDIITGQSRILENGESETFYSSSTQKDEDVHISLIAYSSNGNILSSNGEKILNISNNDDTSSDIVDIADNGRITTYTNQKYSIEYMKTFYNLLIKDTINRNLEKVLKGKVEDSYDQLSGLLINKVDNLIYNNISNNTIVGYEYNGVLHSSEDNGKEINNKGSWYTKALEVINPSGEVGSLDSTEMSSVVTADGFISSTGEHLISYYNNFMKYFQFIINYDVYGGKTFLEGSPFISINSDQFKKFIENSDNNTSEKSVPIYRKDNLGNYVHLVNTTSVSDKGENTFNITKNNLLSTLLQIKMFADNELTFEINPIITKASSNLYNLFYFDENKKMFRVLKGNNLSQLDLYDENGKKSSNGSFLKVYLNGDDYESNNNHYILTGFNSCYILKVDHSNLTSSDYQIPLSKFIGKLKNKYNNIDLTKSYTLLQSGQMVTGNAIVISEFLLQLALNSSSTISVQYTKIGDDDTSLIQLSLDDTYELIYSILEEDYGFKPVRQLFTSGIPAGQTSLKTYQLSKVSDEKYVKVSDLNKSDSSIEEISSIYNDYSTPSSLNQVYNKLSSYSGLISNELDGKGRNEILSLNDVPLADIDYTQYSLTTIFNYLCGGFEAIVNNMGSVTDYSNYTSLKYLIKQIESDLDLRSTYLTLINVHKNTILDLSTELATNNASVILGDETLNNLYTILDSVVNETNYLITNIFGLLLNSTYDLYKLNTLVREDNGEIYSFYFYNKDEDVEGKRIIRKNMDPIGVNQEDNLKLSEIGKTVDSYEKNFHGILPVLETILIDLIGENHYGDTRITPNGQSLLEIYQDIKDGYTVEGLTQATYEDFYTRLMDAMDKLSIIFNIATAFINEKYITDIVNNLVGELNLDSLSVKYDNKTYNVLDLVEIASQNDEDENISVEEIITDIKDSVIATVNNDDDDFKLPYAASNVHPVIMYPSFVINDILNSIVEAKTSKNTVKNNIDKQKNILSTLNTLCYDNVVQDVSQVISLANGSDGDFTYDDSSASILKKRESMINDIRIKAYKGTWNEEVTNKDVLEFDHILDANYENPVKNAIVTLARDIRQDFFFWADTKVQNTIKDALDWKDSYSTSTYFMSVISQSQKWYDEYTSRQIGLTSTYLLANKIPSCSSTYGVQYPIAGSKRGIVDGFESCDWYPNESYKEELYKKKINYLEKDMSTTRIGAQNTNYPSGPLGSINNMLVLLKIKRQVEKIARTYQFEFNTSAKRTAMNTEINTYLNKWVSNEACTEASASVYVSDYDIAQKIVRVDVTLKFTGVIERIVINIDCPAN